MIPTFLRPRALVLMLMVLSSPASNADDPNELATGCAGLQSRLERLQCYDALFRPASSTVSGGDPRPALWHAINVLEQGRGDDFSLRVAQPDNGDVLMSAPALGAMHPRPRLVISCENDITHFQIHVDEPLGEGRVRLRLKTPSIDIERPWRIRDEGYVVSGGRGLPAIDTLQRLLDANTLTLGSNVDALDGLRFDLTGLRARIEPLRNACRW
ncbi:type VI secretion system protein VasI [Modicisalibacter ilicicola DSM 19980]|uniref:Type VI secretion system protein VasI n=1 Tax=Modicisalibacter ilicicola DSM 19980 TaxID=1121942 RepID=A0A1M5B3A2_9GAMM|nr:type VI secretion system-associated protein VasI [Halomonas ilicicola]SHF36994.1 type VI secretion system protein VasI [Halomonas ilicicola DSM 19980]